MTARKPTLHEQRAAVIAERDRIEALLERRANVTEQIDYLALVVSRLPGQFTVAQSRSLKVIGREVLRQSGMTRVDEVAA